MHVPYPDNLDYPLYHQRPKHPDDSVLAVGLLFTLLGLLTLMAGCGPRPPECGLFHIDEWVLHTPTGEKVKIVMMMGWSDTYRTGIRFPNGASMLEPCKNLRRIYPGPNQVER